MITELTVNDLNALLDLTPKALPDNPTKMGWTAQRIKEKMWQGYQKLFSFLKRLSDEVKDYGASSVEIDSSIPLIRLKNDKGIVISESTIMTAASITQSEERIVKAKTVFSFVKDEIEDACKELTELINENKAEISNIKSGETIVEKARRDALGNDIHESFVAQDEKMSTQKQELMSDYDSKFSLAYRKLREEFQKAGYDAEMSYSQNDGKITLKLKRFDGAVIATQTIDLPTELTFTNVRYDSPRKELVFTLHGSGSDIRVPLGDMLIGLLYGTDIIDNLSSDDDSKVLSAKQGKVLDTKKVNYGDFGVVDAFVSSVNINGVEYGVASSVNLAFTPKTIETKERLVAIGDKSYLYMVTSDRHLYAWIRQDWEDLGLYNQDYVLVTDVIDNLQSEYPNKPLSAKQGMELEQRKLAKDEMVYATINDLPNIFGGIR